MWGGMECCRVALGDVGLIWSGIGWCEWHMEWHGVLLGWYSVALNNVGVMWGGLEWHQMV